VSVKAVEASSTVKDVSTRNDFAFETDLCKPISMHVLGNLLTLSCESLVTPRQFVSSARNQMLGQLRHG
jgi:hypothetical protein